MFVDAFLQYIKFLADRFDLEVFVELFGFDVAKLLLEGFLIGLHVDRFDGVDGLDGLDLLEWVDLLDVDLLDVNLLRFGDGSLNCCRILNFSQLLNDRGRGNNGRSCLNCGSCWNWNLNGSWSWNRSCNWNCNWN
jgi:hypothetical protein